VHNAWHMKPFSLTHYLQLFRPKLLTVLHEGYGPARFIKDLIAGLTVAVVALPLAMGIAIGSGAPPERGLITAIIAGFLISALGGSRYQIGGPTAAFIVVVYRTIEHHGYDGMVLATFLAGIMLLVVGLLRLGNYIKYIPYPVTIGFTAGIGVTIMVSQMADLFGLSTDKLPGEFVPKVWALIHAMPTAKLTAIGLSLGCFIALLVMQKYRPHWPRMLVVVVGASLAVAGLSLDVTTIGTKFGAIASSLPMPQWPVFTLEKVRAVLPDAATIALLAGIESLLSAVVADGMTGRRHRSNAELVAQGIANIITPLFGGLPATGAIARTATNIRAGSTGPVSGIMHAVFLLIFMMVAAPLASYVPLAVLAVILAIVAWNMSEVHVVGEFLSHATWGDRVVLLTTMALTVLYDLTLGIEVGVVLAAFKFMHNMANVVEIETNVKLVEEERPDVVRAPRPYFDIPNLDQSVVIYRIHGPFFFGAATELTATMGRDRQPPRLLILDFADVPLLDSTGASALKGVIGGAKRKGTKVIITHASKRILRSMVRYGVKRPEVMFYTAPSIERALEIHKAT